MTRSEHATRSPHDTSDPVRIDVLTVDVPPSWFAEAGAAPWVDSAAEHLSGGGSVTIRLAREGLPGAAAELISRARAALLAVTTVMRQEHLLPGDAYVEVDEESYGTPTAPRGRSRFLLPHQDGAHSSFLTPRRENDGHGVTDDRMFSNTVFFKRPSHKMYQGFLITRPGAFPGETYYYNLIALLVEAYRLRFGAPPERGADVERFLGDNIARSLRLSDVHRSRYLTLGSLLGSANPAHHVLPSGPRAESELWPEQYASIPGIWGLVEGCPCGACEGPGARLVCHATFETLGLSWPGVRERYESTVVGERGDLLIGNNLSQMHAAFSARDRQICPVCVVVDKPAGPEYESWLAREWEQGLARLGVTA
ncbi:hypothetical protein [Streptosporangium carneum]|uniref:Uncharacterized protein n=1 Tax=Streptosporangium carneum TaxID=47481 RepID=A0A9W6HXJ9_9ACTN|nr:hypothetical protein [Streptosporangium carneum]GLK07878.1 hypothetical protein GCM10017600_12830 [Streptosporangium carneum]